MAIRSAARPVIVGQVAPAIADAPATIAEWMPTSTAGWPLRARGTGGTTAPVSCSSSCCAASRHAGRTPGALVLDAGGGTGATGGWMTEYAPTVLADFEPMALEVARDEHDPVCDPVRADLNHLPFADDSFDVVLCVTALCHRMNPDPAAIVRDFARVTRPGGVVCLMEPGGKRLWRGHDEVTHTARRFSVRRALDRWWSAAGLEVQRATGAYSFLVPPAGGAAASSNAARRRATSVATSPGSVARSGVLARAERRLLRRVDLPIGLSAIALARKPD